MTEIKDKVLPGEVTDTPSSDAYNERALSQMRADLAGTNGQVVNITPSETYSPVSALTQPLGETSGIDTMATGHTVQMGPLNHTHSKTAFNIRGRREAHRHSAQKIS